MTKARVLALVVSLTINNIRLKHVLIDVGANLNILSLYPFEASQIPCNNLTRANPFAKISIGLILPTGAVKFPITFSSCKNLCSEYVEFIVANL
jgi:hypothetical protein